MTLTRLAAPSQATVSESREAIDSFLASPTVAQAREKFGDPTYSVHRIAAYLDRRRVIVPPEVAPATPRH